MQHYRFPVVFTFLVIILLVYTFTVSKDEQEPTSLNHKGITLQSLVQLEPTVEFRSGTNVISQIPFSPKAVLFLADGCNGKAAKFWDNSPGCPNCIGLPERGLLFFMLLHKNLLCLQYPVSEKNNLGKVPSVALRASSGGYFVSVLANDVKFSSIVVMTAEGVFQRMDIRKNYSPTLFVHMPKDRRRMWLIGENMESLRQKGVDVAEVKCTEFPLTPYFLSDRIPGINGAISFELNGFMRKDGLATRWKEALKERKNVRLDKSKLDHVQEELNLAFAYHEMTSLQNEQIFNWFESHMR
ncbi:hypothetical protein MKX01_019930 [Papaver californicum]|nr:hypothetical protein MKX01_019930 [Papaver californicum]